MLVEFAISAAVHATAFGRRTYVALWSVAPGVAVATSVDLFRDVSPRQSSTTRTLVALHYE